MKDYLVVLIAFGCLVMGLLGGLAITDTKVVEVEKQVIVEVPTAVNDTKIDYLYNQASEEDQLELLAKEAIMDEIDSNSFKRDLFDKLKRQTNIDEYKDIERVRVLDSDIDVDVDDETGEAEFDLKVYYYLDGDDEEDERAKFTVLFDIEELKLNDEPELDYSLNLEKIYE